MSDRSAQIAKLLMENRELSLEQKRQLVETRFPGCTMEAQELLRAEAAEYFDEADALKAIQQRREAARRAQK